MDSNIELLILRTGCRIASLVVPSTFVCGAWLLIGVLTISAACRAGEPPAESNLPDQVTDAQAKAAEAAELILRQAPDDPRAFIAAADLLLRSGSAARAVELYDRFIQQRPAAMPGLWQRGIALYFTGQYRAAAQQFVHHRQVNPHDVENAAWHYLCVAKAESVEKANESVLPAPNDSRVPMAEVQQMLLQQDPTIVANRLASLSPGAANYDSGMFYGNFYLGLYADAQGNDRLALDKMSLAAKTAPGHYMGDVARVYARHLKKRSRGDR